MTDAQTFRLVHPAARNGATEAVKRAPDGYVCEVRPPKRSLPQNAIFHAMCDDIAKAKPIWAGLHMDADDWKALLIVSHAVATKTPGATRMIPDLEGNGLVQLRESSAQMLKPRATSLIDYCIAWATSHGIQLRDQ